MIEFIADDSTAIYNPNLKKEDEINRFLMIRRRNTIGFVEFIRGQYVYSDIDYLEKLIDVILSLF